MINNELLTKVCDKFLVTNNITIKEMIQLGFKPKDIKKLLLLNFIKVDEVGNYIINDVDFLYSYGKELLESGYIDKAYIVFKKCYEIDNTFRDLLYDLYFTSLDNKDYEGSFTYFNNLNVGKSR